MYVLLELLFVKIWIFFCFLLISGWCCSCYYKLEVPLLELLYGAKKRCSRVRHTTTAYTALALRHVVKRRTLLINVNKWVFAGLIKLVKVKELNSSALVNAADVFTEKPVDSWFNAPTTLLCLRQSHADASSFISSSLTNGVNRSLPGHTSLSCSTLR